MQVERVEYDATEAAKLLRKYREHRAWSTPIDFEIERIASLVVKGKVVIRALDSIRTAGLNEQALPKLALARADWKRVYLDMNTDGSAIMHDVPSHWMPARMAANRRFDLPAGSFAPRRQHHRAEAIVPHIPPDIRPKRGLANYHVLFEAEWSRMIPVDPMLLRRIGKEGDLWIVVAAWELTEVERAVLASFVGKPRQ